MFKGNGLLIVAVIVGFFLLKDTKEANSDISQAEYLRIKADLAHNLASEITSKPVNPDLEPDNNVIPELANCPLCKGTKQITHADGHKTPCPYHGNANEELEDAIMNLSARIADKEKQFFELIADVKDTKGKLALIDQNHKVEPQTKLIANSCPCGCNHLVKDCNCAASCPGKQLEVYKQVAIISPERREVRQERREERTPIKTVLPPYPIIRTQSYTIECSNGYCSSTRRPIIRRIGRWR